MKDLVLGVESAIQGGSIALFRGREKLAFWTGKTNLSGAEQILPEIDSLLHGISADISDVATIVVSTGPGSFTGIRVGIATALGLRASTGAQCIGVTAFEAIANSAETDKCTVALPMGSDMICVQSFSFLEPGSGPQLISQTDLFNMVVTLESSQLFIYASIYKQEPRFESHGAVEIGPDIGSLLCLSKDSRFASTDMRPLFVDRKAFTKI